MLIPLLLLLLLTLCQSNLFGLTLSVVWPSWLFCSVNFVASVAFGSLKLITKPRDISGCWFRCFCCFCCLSYLSVYPISLGLSISVLWPYWLFGSVNFVAFVAFVGFGSLKLISKPRDISGCWFRCFCCFCCLSVLPIYLGLSLSVVWPIWLFGSVDFVASVASLSYQSLIISHYVLCGPLDSLEVLISLLLLLLLDLDLWNWSQN